MPKWKVQFVNQAGHTTAEEVEADLLIDNPEGWIDFAKGSKGHPLIVLRLPRDRVYRVDLVSN